MLFEGQHILVAYFSKGGENLVNGKVVDLGAEGNTKKVAELLAKSMGQGDLMEIKPLVPYSLKYAECVKRTKDEKDANGRPQLDLPAGRIQGYDMVFLCYPNWWGTCPMAILSFLDHYKDDLKGLPIIPVVTHGGQRSLYSVADIQAEVPDSVIFPSLEIAAAYMSGAEERVTTYLEQMTEGTAL